MKCPQCECKVEFIDNVCPICDYKKESVGHLKINPTAKYANFETRFCAGFIDFILFFIILAIVGRTGLWEDSFLRLFIFLTILAWLYYAFLESSDLQASLGKKAFGFIVADSEGSKITFWKATCRYFLFLITMFNIGLIMMVFSEKKQGFHDLMTDTFVLGNTDNNPKQYKIFRHPAGSNEAVKQGWLWPAFFFTWIWALFKKMWVLGAGVFVGCFVVYSSIAFSIIRDSANVKNPVIYVIFMTTFIGSIIQIIIGYIFGMGGRIWREKNLVSRGFEQVDTVTAANPEGALAIYLKAASTER